MVFFLFPTKSIVLNQILFALVMIVAAAIYYGELTGVSVGIGCGVALLPCFIFHKVFFVRRRHLYPSQIVNRFYLAALYKFLALIVLFIGAAQWVDLETNMFFLSFVIMQSVCWGSYLVLLRDGKIQ